MKVVGCENRRIDIWYLKEDGEEELKVEPKRLQ